MAVAVSTRMRRAVACWQACHADPAPQLAIAHALTVLPALYLTLDAALRWARLPVPLAAQAAAAVLLYAALLWWRPLGTGRIPPRLLALIAFLLAAFWLVAAALFDTSWDGTSYHLPAELALADGWNPIARPSGIPPADVQANGLWTLRAALFALTGSVEGSKALNLLFLLAALFTLVPAWTLRLGRPLGARELALLYAAVGNPVALGQVLTFYVDGTVYEGGLIVLGAAMLAGPRWHRAALGLLCAGIVVLTGTKLSGVYFAALLVPLGLLAAGQPIRASGRPLALAAGTLALALLAIGFRPYVTNIRDYGHLVELGPGTNMQRPPELQATLPPVMLAASLLARTDSRTDLRLKWPVTLRLREVASMGVPDPRVGGFGPLFALQLLAGLCAGGLALQHQGTALRRDPAVLVALGLGAICAVFPEPWLARYAPFVWGAPIFLALADGGRTLLTRWCTALVLVLALANGGMAFAGNLARTVLGDIRLRAMLHDLAAQPEPVLIVPITYRAFEVTDARRFTAAGIKFRIGASERTPENTSPQCARVLYADRVLICEPVAAPP